MSEKLVRGLHHEGYNCFRVGMQQCLQPSYEKQGFAVCQASQLQACRLPMCIEVQQRRSRQIKIRDRNNQSFGTSDGPTRIAEGAVESNLCEGQFTYIAEAKFTIPTVCRLSSGATRATSSCATLRKSDIARRLAC